MCQSAPVRALVVPVCCESGFGRILFEWRRSCFAQPLLGGFLHIAGAMIHVDKENVEASLRLRMVEIREREFNHFLERTRSVATIATIMSGLGQFGLLYTKFINHNGCATPICPELLYPFFCVVSTFCSTLTAFVCILLVTHAPAVMLHGTLDRYSECVDSLVREFSIVIVLGALSVSSFMIAAVVYFWAKFLQHSHRGLHGPHGGGGLGAAQHTWASSFAHGEAIHAVRDLPTALLLSARKPARPPLLRRPSRRSQPVDCCVGDAPRLPLRDAADTRLPSNPRVPAAPRPRGSRQLAWRRRAGSRRRPRHLRSLQGGRGPPCAPPAIYPRRRRLVSRSARTTLVGRRVDRV